MTTEIVTTTPAGPPSIPIAQPTQTDLQRSARYEGAWKFVTDKVVGPAIVLLLTGILLVCFGYIPQFSFLEKRVGTLQNEIDRRLTELGAIDVKVDMAKDKVNAINAAAAMSDDDWRRLKLAADWLKQNKDAAELVARVSQLEKQNQDQANTFAQFKSDHGGLVQSVRELWNGLATEKPNGWYDSHAKP